GVLERGGDLGLAEESEAAIGVVGAVVLKLLEGDLAVELLVASDVDLPERAAGVQAGGPGAVGGRGRQGGAGAGGARGGDVGAVGVGAGGGVAGGCVLGHNSGLSRRWALHKEYTAPRGELEA